MRPQSSHPEKGSPAGMPSSSTSARPADEPPRPRNDTIDWLGPAINPDWKSRVVKPGTERSRSGTVCAADEVRFVASSTTTWVGSDLSDCSVRVAEMTTASSAAAGCAEPARAVAVWTESARSCAASAVGRKASDAATRRACRAVEVIDVMEWMSERERPRRRRWSPTPGRERACAPSDLRRWPSVGTARCSPSRCAIRRGTSASTPRA